MLVEFNGSSARTSKRLTVLGTDSKVQALQDFSYSSSESCPFYAEPFPARLLIATLLVNDTV